MAFISMFDILLRSLAAAIEMELSFVLTSSTSNDYIPIGIEVRPQGISRQHRRRKHTGWAVIKIIITQFNRIEKTQPDNPTSINYTYSADSHTHTLWYYCIISEGGSQQIPIVISKGGSR